MQTRYDLAIASPASTSQSTPDNRSYGLKTVADKGDSPK